MIADIKDNNNETMCRRRINISWQVAIVMATLSLVGCDRDDTGMTTTTPDNAGPVENYQGPSTIPAAGSGGAGYNIDNTRYFFDVSDHTVEELEALLVRIEEITDASPETFDRLEIVMILHGPDIGLFTRANYEHNRRLVDLAAKLDAFRVVDMKACEASMDSLGVNRGDIPAFIESVPYAPDEIRRLQEQGYINL